MDSNFEVDLRSEYRRTLLFWSISVTSVVMYVAVALVLGAVSDPAFTGLDVVPAQQRGLMSVVFIGASVAAIFATGVMAVLRRSRERTPAAMSTTTILLSALIELPALFGLLFYLLFGRWLVFIVLAVLTVVQAFVYFPRPDVWHERAREMIETRREG